MFAHIATCKETKQSQFSYCKEHEIAHSTFGYWTKKYRESKHATSNSSPGFIAIKVQPDPEPNHVRKGGQLHFLFPNGIQVLCPEDIDPVVLKILLNP